MQDVARKHQIRIAKRTLELSDEGAMILGGMTKEEARKILDKNGIKYKEWWLHKYLKSIVVTPIFLILYLYYIFSPKDFQNKKMERINVTVIKI